jgi:hypothetical protein
MMGIRSSENSFGAWAFLIGVILAVIIGLSTSSFLSLQKVVAYSTQIYAVLIIIGLLVGFSINVSGKDAQTFLIAGAVLVIVSKFGMESVTGSLIGIGIGDTVSSTFASLLVLFVPATIIVALKTVFSVAKV